MEEEEAGGEHTLRVALCPGVPALPCGRKSVGKELELLIWNSLATGTRIKRIVQNKVLGFSVDKMASGSRGLWGLGSSPHSPRTPLSRVFTILGSGKPRGCSHCRPREGSLLSDLVNL